MVVDSTTLLQAHKRGSQAHHWHYLPHEGHSPSVIPVGGLEQELSELAFCLYLMERYRFNTHELVFESSNHKELEELVRPFECLFEIMVEKPLTIRVRSASPKESRIIQSQIDDNAHFSKVSLFSGGVDSTVGMQLLKREQENALLSHTMTHPIPYGRARKVIQRFGTDMKLVVSDARVKVPSGWMKTGETVVHSRGLLFLTNALLIAHSMGIPKVVLPESGPFILNIETSQADKSTRTTHPLLIDVLTDLFKKINANGIEVEVPFAAWTKAELMCSDELHPLLGETHSCFYTQGLSGDCMCGICYSCIVRSLSAFAAGVENYDGNYSNNIMTLHPKHRSEQEKIEIMHDVLRFYSKSIEDPSYLNEHLRGIYLGHIYTRRDVTDLLVRFGSDLLLGVREMVHKLPSTELGPLGRYALKLLQNFDNAVLDTRKQELESIKSEKFENWNIGKPPV